MKIGIFDSGLGGLFVLKSVVQALPEYNYVYFGDTKNLPYGNKNQTEIYNLTKTGIEFLFKKNCNLVILACNTVSASALRKIQQKYLPEFYPDKKVLGVIVPAIEEVFALGFKKVGIIATKATVNSGYYLEEFNKKDKAIQVYQEAAPELVPLIEAGRFYECNKFLEKILKGFAKKEVGVVVLACTHYGILKKRVEEMVGKEVVVLSQDEIIPRKLRSYLGGHKDIESKVGRAGDIEVWLSSDASSYKTKTKDWFNKEIKFKLKAS